MTEEKRVAIYARVSKDEAHNDNRYQEIENQLHPLRLWAKSLNFIVVKEYNDKWSGADPNRESFRQMLDDARVRKFDAILIWKLDRFSREPMTVVLSYINKLRRYKVGLLSQTESWLDTRQDNPVVDLVLAIMSWMAAEERRKISERTRAGIARRKAIGQWKGGRPKGSKDKHKRKRGGI